MATPSVTMDEFHLTFTAPAALPPAAFAAIRRALDARRFEAELGRAARAALRRRPALARVRVAVSR